MSPLAVKMIEAPNSFFFNDTATTEIYTLSLHDALPIFPAIAYQAADGAAELVDIVAVDAARSEEHTSELQSRGPISYPVLCLKKKQRTTRRSRSARTQARYSHRRRDPQV